MFYIKDEILAEHGDVESQAESGEFKNSLGYTSSRPAETISKKLIVQ